MRNKIILTDCDGVSLDWEYAFDVWMREHGFNKQEGCQLNVWAELRGIRVVKKPLFKRYIPGTTPISLGLVANPTLVTITS
jgi:hypothetical protein